MRLILGLLLAFVAANTAAKWTYESRRDEMRDTLTESYQSTSLNKLNFKFPYNGGSTGTLVVRRMNNEIDVIVE